MGKVPLEWLIITPRLDPIVPLSAGHCSLGICSTSLTLTTHMGWSCLCTEPRCFWPCRTAGMLGGGGGEEGDDN